MSKRRKTDASFIRLEADEDFYGLSSSSQDSQSFEEGKDKDGEPMWLPPEILYRIASGGYGNRDFIDLTTYLKMRNILFSFQVFRNIFRELMSRTVLVTPFRMSVTNRGMDVLRTILESDGEFLPHIFVCEWYDDVWEPVPYNNFLDHVVFPETFLPSNRGELFLKPSRYIRSLGLSSSYTSRPTGRMLMLPDVEFPSLELLYSNSGRGLVDHLTRFPKLTQVYLRDFYTDYPFETDSQTVSTQPNRVPLKTVKPRNFVWKNDVAINELGESLDELRQSVGDLYLNNADYPENGMDYWIWRGYVRGSNASKHISSKEWMERVQQIKMRALSPHQPFDSVKLVDLLNNTWPFPGLSRRAEMQCAFDERDKLHLLIDEHCRSLMDGGVRDGKVLLLQYGRVDIQQDNTYSRVRTECFKLGFLIASSVFDEVHFLFSHQPFSGTEDVWLSVCAAVVAGAEHALATQRTPGRFKLYFGRWNQFPWTLTEFVPFFPQTHVDIDNEVPANVVKLAEDSASKNNTDMDLFRYRGVQKCSVHFDTRFDIRYKPTQRMMREVVYFYQHIHTDLKMRE
jgi:hypothetical protein